MRLQFVVGILAALTSACSVDAAGLGSEEFLGDASAPRPDTRPSMLDTAVVDSVEPDTFVADSSADIVDTADTFVEDTMPLDTGCGDACPIVASCKELHATSPGLPSGVYTLSDGNAYCDMATDGGGWTLVLAYNHAAATTPPIAPGTRPIDPTSGFSHANGAQMLALAAFDTVRFFCSTTSHTRQIHFKTSDPDVVNYVRGDPMARNTDAMWKTFTPLAGHTAKLPAATDSTPGVPFNPAVDQRLTEFPFFDYADAHWAVGGSGTRWECDDWGGNAYATTHQVWVR